MDFHRRWGLLLKRGFRPSRIRLLQLHRPFLIEMKRSIRNIGPFVFSKTKGFSRAWEESLFSSSSLIRTYRSDLTSRNSSEMKPRKGRRDKPFGTSWSKDCCSDSALLVLLIFGFWMVGGFFAVAWIGAFAGVSGWRWTATLLCACERVGDWRVWVFNVTEDLVLSFERPEAAAPTMKNTPVKSK